MVLTLMQGAWAKTVQISVRQGNQLYAQGKFNKAIDSYEQALLEKPHVLEPKYNKANSYYRLDDLAEAMDLYKEVAAESKDMELVSKAKYNLGNCYFQRGSKQRDSDLQKALEDLKTSITNWRQVLDIDPKNEKAAKNIEVARLIIKDIIDQLNKQKQQQDPNQPQDPNQGQAQQQPKDLKQDPNQPQDPNQSQQQKTSGQDPNQSQEQQQAQQKKQEKNAPDTTAQEILDKEQRQKKQRQILQRSGYQKVEKNW
jgi:tetratricopeptide (TPR) repeat protein